MTTENIIGIDLGTTYSVAAIYQNGTTEIIPNENGDRTTPSCVAFTDNERIIGKAAVYLSADNPENTIFGVKRLIGREFNDVNVQKIIKTFPYKVEEKNDRLTLVAQHKGKQINLYPEMISSMILQDLKKSAEAYLGAKVTKAVITVPAYFNNAQRQSTMDSAKIAGLEVVKLINEPTAAALAYGRHNEKKKIILVYDFGGGTFDVSLLRMNGKEFEVIGIDGDPYLGGEDIDNCVLEYFVEKFKNEGFDISARKGLLRQLRTRCEEAKRMLSSALEAAFALDGTDLKGSITRALFEDLNHNLFDRTIVLVDQLITNSRLSKTQIDDIVLVGGSSRIPKVQKMLQEYFNGKPLNKNVNPDECVAIGASIQAAMLMDVTKLNFKGLKLIDVNPLSLGFELFDGSMKVVIPRNSRIPITRSEIVRVAHPDQTDAEVKIYEGERFMCSENHFLGSFELTNVPQDGHIEVIYEIDANGILNVKAIEETTQNSNQIKIDNKGHLTHVEIQELIADAMKHSEDDQRERDRVRSLNQYEDYLYSVRRSMETSLENDRETYDIVKNEIDGQIDWFKEHRSVSKEEFNQKYEELKAFWAEICETLTN